MLVRPEHLAVVYIHIQISLQSPSIPSILSIPSWIYLLFTLKDQTLWLLKSHNSILA